MNLNCIGFYFIKSSSFKKDSSQDLWTAANISISAEMDRYLLEIKHIGEEDDIYDEDEDDKGLRATKKIRLNDFKGCEPRGCQRYKINMIYVLALIPKMFSKAKKVLLAFYSEEVQISWYKNLEMILTHRYQNNASLTISADTNSAASVENFMIDNEVYEGSNMPGEFIATVIDNEKSSEIGIKGQYVLIVTDIGLELRHESIYELVKFWEIKNIRKFGVKDNVFFMELGKHCDEGPGFLSFKVTNAKAFWEQLIKCKDHCLKNKQDRTSVFNKSDHPSQVSVRSTKITEEGRDSVLENMVANMTYNTANYRSSSMNENRKTSFEPPRVAPPPIPPTVPSVAFETI